MEYKEVYGKGGNFSNWFFLWLLSATLLIFIGLTGSSHFWRGYKEEKQFS